MSSTAVMVRAMLAWLTIVQIVHGKTDPHERICPEVFGCRCDFHRNVLSCFNVSAVPEIPRWISGVHMNGINGRHGGHHSMSLTKRGHIPNNVRTFAVENYLQVEIAGEFFEEGSKLVGFALSKIGKTFVARNIFMNTRKISALTIERCNLDRLETDTLSGLKLKRLIIGSNKLSQNQVSDILCSIDSSGLEVVDLSSMKLRYIPLKVAKCIRSRRSLSFSLQQNDFSDLPSLQALGKVMNIKRLDLGQCKITSAETLNFTRGMNLTQIGIGKNNLTAVEVKTILCNLNQKTIKVIRAGGNRLGYINDDFFKCLAKSNVNYLVLTHCNITGISRFAFRHFRRSLSLNLDYNRIQSDDLSFVGAAKVRSIELGHNALEKFPDFKVNGSCVGAKRLIELHLYGNLIHTIKEADTQCLKRVQVLVLKRNKIVKLPERALAKMTSLQELSLSSNKMESLGEDSLPPQLLQLDLLDNSFVYAGLVPIGRLNNLEKLFVSGTDGLWSSLFANKTKLKTLRIANGDAGPTCIKHVLQVVTNVEYLNLVRVRLREVPEEILGLKRLKTLVLVGNKLEGIQSHYIPKLKSLKMFDVSYNNFLCNCSIVPFVDWLKNASRQTSVKALDFTQCYSPLDLRGTPLFNLEIDCRDLLLIILLSVLLPIALLSFITTVVCVRYRGYIRYGCMLVSARWRGYGAIQGRSFKYDAFVSYNSQDREWVLRVLRPKLEDETGYHICLHERDFTIGEEIVDNIIESIDESRKTILVVSDSFAQSQWCQLEMSLAQHKLFEDNRDVLIMIRVGEVAPENMTKTMRMLMRTKTYITWPQSQGEGGHDLFWKNLIFALRRPPGVVMEPPEELPVAGDLVQDAAND